MLETLSRVAAPLVPLISERVWQGLTGGRSVHLTDWPDASAFPAADEIRDAMDAVRELSSVGNALRKKEKLRVRLPLARLTVVSPLADSLGQFEDILREELNVKSVELVQLTDTAAAEYGISHRLSVNARAAGPRLGKEVQRVIRAAKDGFWTEDAGVVTADGVVLEPHEYELVLETTGRPEGEALAIVPSGGFVLLDTLTTPELESEGLARDAIRVVQEARKNADLDVSDRIVLTLDVAVANVDALLAHGEFIAGETLATSWAVSGVDDIDVLVDAATSGGGFFKSGARALGSEKSGIVVTIERAGATNV